MQQKFQQRLAVLREEFETDHWALQEFPVREAKLRESLLRISGAIQVLEEELAKDDVPEAPASPVRAVG